MKETIEWYSASQSDIRPIAGESILMKMRPGVSGELRGVHAGTFFEDVGFLLQCRESVSPVEWCYMPKGPQ